MERVTHRDRIKQYLFDNKSITSWEAISVSYARYILKGEDK